MLRQTYQPLLADCGTVGNRKQPRRIGPDIREHFPELFAVGIVADNSQAHGSGPQSGKVRNYRAGPAAVVLGPGHLEHRDGRFRAYAQRVAVGINIEHEVAHNKDPRRT